LNPLRFGAREEFACSSYIPPIYGENSSPVEKTDLPVEEAKVEIEPEPEPATESDPAPIEKKEEEFEIDLYPIGPGEVRRPKASNSFKANNFSGEQRVSRRLKSGTELTHHVAGYTGHVPHYKDVQGKSFATLTHRCLTEDNPVT
jgi:hypothetical protein